MFLEALALDLQKTQRAIPSSCLFCVPQARSLVADQELTADDLYNHFLTPAGTPTDAHARRPGDYDTLNGKTVSIQGSHIHTGRGFDEKRKVRILLSEQKEVHHQEVTVLHLSRPLSGGIALPEDPNELDVATFRRFTAILRSFPENELVFYQLDETIAQVKKICTHNQFFNRYEQTLPSLLQEEWEIAVDEILQAGSFEDDSDDDDEDREGYRHHQPQHSSHLLQIQQVVECYLMEQLHDFIFPRVVISCRAQEQTLSQVLYRMRHYSPEDFGIRKEFQCFVQDAVDALVDVKDRKTPLDMLLAFKSCIDSINDAITRNLKQHNLDLGRYQMTTDDILDQLLFVLVQAFNQTTLFGSSSSEGDDDESNDENDDNDTTTQRHQSLSSSFRDQEGAEDKDADANSDPQNSASIFPIAAVLKYISDYHFINSNTTALGFTIANFEVAIEYFLMRAAHIETCRICIQSLQVERSGGGSGTSEALILSTCSQGILLSKCEAAYERNARGLHTLASELNNHLRHEVDDHDGDDDDDRDKGKDGGGGGFKQLFIVGDWSPASSSTSSSSEKEESEEDEEYVNVSSDDHFHARGGQFPPSEVNTAVRVNRVAVSALTDTSSSNSTATAATITQISAGQRFFAAVNDQGYLFTWGDRSGGRLGYTSAAGDARRQQIPRRVVAGVFEKCHVINVACGAFHTLATDVNGHVFAWGSNARGQLGFLTHETISESSASMSTTTTASTVVATPTLVSDLRGTYVSSVACGEYHSLALSSDGRVFSWGCNKYSKLGRVTKSFADAVQPKALDESWTGFGLDLKTVQAGEESHHENARNKKIRKVKHSVVRRIAAGKDHSLAISFEGTVFTWGRGDSGQLGHGSFMDIARPKQVMALSRQSQSEAPSGFSVVDTAGGSDFSIFLVSTGAAFVSGRDPSASGNTMSKIQSTLFPELIEHNSRHQVIGISCGEAHFGLHLSNGTLLVSNSNYNSVEGESDGAHQSDEDTEDDLSNHQRKAVKQRQLELVGFVRNIKRIACGGSHALVLS